MSTPIQLLIDNEGDPPIVTEDEQSEDFTHTATQSLIDHPIRDQTENSTEMSQSPEPDTRTFGTAIQKFSKDLIKSLSNFKFSDELTDDNFVSWSQAVSELLQSIDLDLFITKEKHVDRNLSELENQKTRFIVTTFILNHLDGSNNLQSRNHLSDPDDPQVLIYDPHKLWTFLKNRHAKITEVKLTVVTKALYACNIQRNDSLSNYLDKFENLI